MSNPKTEPIPIRMSSAGYCPRRQAYAALDAEVSNPPDRQAENRMALGDAAENILINNLIADGWEVTDTRAVPGGEQLELEIADPLPMTGHPDGVCRHPVHTRDRWVTLECKSMSDARLLEVANAGIAAVYPEYLAQAMTYSRVLYEMGRVVHPHRAVFACLSREGEYQPPERVSWQPEAESSLWQRLTNTWSAIHHGELPERPYQADNPKCAYCPYFTLCHDAEPPDWRSPHRIEDASVIEAAQLWLDADTQRRNAAATLRAATAPYENGIIAGPVQASQFYPRSAQEYDPDRLHRLVPADVLRECRRENAPKPAFWIRRANRN